MEMDKKKLIEEEIEKMATILQAENSDLAMVKKRKEDFSNFVTHTLQNSMLTGIPQIAQASNCSKRVVRTLVFFFCIGGFIYQSLSFMKIYWEYDVVMDVQVTNPFFIEPPAVTICHKRGIMMDELCRDPSADKLRKDHDLYCESVEYVLNITDHVSCKCNPRICDDKGNPRDWMWISPIDRTDTISYEEIKPWLIPPDKIATTVQVANAQTRGGELPLYLEGPEYINQIPCAFDGTREACATVLAKYGEPNKTFPEISITTKLLIGIPFHPKYEIEDRSTNQVYASVHDPRTVINPFKDGVMLTPWKNYVFRVNQVEKRLLPAPYKTDCADYRGLWESRGGKGPLNIKECLLECQVNASLQLYGCVIGHIYFVGFLTRCEFKGDDTDRMIKVNALANRVSEKVCKPACEETYYEKSLQIQEYNDAYCEEDKFPLAWIHVVFDGMEVTRYSYNPKYQDIETFSYVGGYVGMWLGISLVAVFDFLETIFLMMKYPLRRFKAFRNKRKIQNQIMHGHLHH